MTLSVAVSNANTFIPSSTSFSGNGCRKSCIFTNSTCSGKDGAEDGADEMLGGSGIVGEVDGAGDVLGE